jgi:predicted small lipoprotein YifL
MNHSTLHQSVIAVRTLALRTMRAIQFSFRADQNWVARTSRAMTIVLMMAAMTSLSACGVKSDLMLPDGKPTPKGEKDPSKPPPVQQQQGL